MPAVADAVAASVSVRAIRTSSSRYKIPTTTMTSMPIQPLITAPREAAQSKARTRAVMSPWTWMAVTCLLLGISGGIRYWREWQFSALAVESAACPFPLVELSREMGTWQATDDSEIQLDPEVAKFAGASEHIIRNYMDLKSGEQATALTLYGPCTMVYLHTPEACYPGAGYKLFRGPVDLSMEVPGLKGPLRYRWAIYAKRVGGINRYEEVYYTFLHHGDWLPDVSDRWKTFRYYPGMFKVQISHPISGSLPQAGEGPIPPLLAEFARQISRRLAPDGPGAPATTVATASPASP